MPEQSDRFIRITRRDGYVAYVSGRPNSLAFDPAEVAPAAPWPERPFRRSKVSHADGAARCWSPDSRPAPAAASVFYLVEVGTSAAPVST